jgi:hypothetical protein
MCVRCSYDRCKDQALCESYKVDPVALKEEILAYQKEQNHICGSPPDDVCSSEQCHCCGFGIYFTHLWIALHRTSDMGWLCDVCLENTK